MGDEGCGVVCGGNWEGEVCLVEDWSNNLNDGCLGVYMSAVAMIWEEA